MNAKNFGYFGRGRILRWVAIGCAAWLTTSLSGQIVAWNVSGINAAANSPLAASTLDGLLTSATLSLGSGLTASATSSTFGGSGFNQTSFAGAISTSDYLSFTLTPSANTDLSLSSISMLFGVASAVTNFNVALASSMTGFTSGDALWSYSFSTASPTIQAVTLSGVSALQHLDSPVELRLYGWRDTAGTTTFRIRDNAGSDLSVAGSISVTAVPEPTTYAAIAGLLSLAGAAYRRRKAADSIAAQRMPLRSTKWSGR